LRIFHTWTRMLDHFCPVPSHIFNEANLVCRGGNNTLMDLQEADELCSLIRVYVTYIDASSFYCCRHFWHKYAIPTGNKRICVTICSPIKMAITFKSSQVCYWYVL
jgi:hypothetical protein